MRLSLARAAGVGVVCAFAALNACSDSLGGDDNEMPDGGPAATPDGDAPTPTPGDDMMRPDGSGDTMNCACDADALSCDVGCDCDERCGGSEAEEPCRGQLDCGDGLHCITFPGDVSGICLQPCGDRDDCGRDFFCFPIEEDADLNGDDMRSSYCIEGCQSDFACGAERACYPVGDDGGGVCLRGGDIQPLERCDGLFSCADGAVCVPAQDPSERVCVVLCDPEATGSCDDGLTCAQFDEGERGICIEGCSDPVTNDCGEGQTCFIDGDNDDGLCIGAGELQEGERCEQFAGQCAEGMLCFGNCARTCRQGQAAEGCRESQICIGDDAAEFGICADLCDDPFSTQSCGDGRACVAAGPWALCLAAGNAQAGESCSELFDCAPAHSCIGGACRPLCDGPHPCADATQECTPIPGTSIGVCITECDDPIGGSGCADGQTCRITEANGNAACALLGGLDFGRRCDSADQCRAGAACFDIGDGQRCHRLCDPDADEGPTACDADQRCRPTEEGSPVGWCGDR